MKLLLFFTLILSMTSAWFMKQSPKSVLPAYTEIQKKVLGCLQRFTKKNNTLLDLDQQNAIGQEVQQFLTQQECRCVYLTSIQQQSLDCGYYAALHVAAIEHLWMNRQPISAHAIQDFVLNHYQNAEYKHLCTIGKPDSMMLSTDAFPYFFGDISSGISSHASSMGDSYYATNVFVLGTQLDLLNENFSPAAFQKTALNDTLALLKGINIQAALVPLLQRFKDKDFEGIAHFICNENNSHWVMFSILKHPNTPPMILHLDSMNAPLTINSPAFPYLAYLCGQVS